MTAPREQRPDDLICPWCRKKVVAKSYEDTFDRTHWRIGCENGHPKVWMFGESKDEINAGWAQWQTE